MVEKKLDEFSFGLLMHINDYEWHHDYGVGSLSSVYKTYEEACEHKCVYPAPSAPEDRNDCWSDIAIKVNVKKLPEQDKILISVERKDETLFDILHPQDISRLIPID